MAKKYIEVEPSVRTLAQKSHFLTTTQWNELLKIITRLPTADIVPRSAYDQIRLERDIAIEQLKELGYGLGEKIIHCQDCVHAEFHGSANPLCNLYYGMGEYDGYCSQGERKDE